MKTTHPDDSAYPPFGDCIAWARVNLGPATVRAMEDAGPDGFMRGNLMRDNPFVKVNDVVLCFAHEQHRKSPVIHNEFIEYFFRKDIFGGMVTRKKAPKNVRETSDIENSIYAFMLEDRRSSGFQGEVAFSRMLRQRATRKINKFCEEDLRESLMREALGKLGSLTTV